MKFDEVSILERIIEHHGDCELFAGPAICKRCPLGNKRIDGERVSCVDYLNVDQMTTEEADEVYLTAANDELFTIQLENHITDNSED